MYEDDEIVKCTHCEKEHEFALMWLAFHEGIDYLLCNSCYLALGKPFSAEDYVSVTACQQNLNHDPAYAALQPA